MSTIKVIEHFVPVEYNTEQEQKFLEKLLIDLKCKHVFIRSRSERGMLLMEKTFVPELRKALEKLDALSSQGGS